MGAETAGAQQVAKRCYKNQTAGWLGVVKLDHLGAQVGFSIAPHGTVWLSDDEAKLTARAPARAEDNPFVAKTFMFEDENHARVEQEMCPLILIEDDREIPSDDRFVPGVGDVSLGGGEIDAATQLAKPSERPISQVSSEPTPVPASAGAVDPALAHGESWTEPPADLTREPQAGSLRGSNDPAPASDDADPVRDGTPQGAPPQRPVNAPPGAAPDVQGRQTVPSESAGVAKGAGSPSEQEEHAGVTEAGEETGAAQTPAGEAPQGEFAAHEEVGSPDAPAAQGEAS